MVLLNLYTILFFISLLKFSAISLNDSIGMHFSRNATPKIIGLFKRNSSAKQFAKV